MNGLGIDTSTLTTITVKPTPIKPVTTTPAPQTKPSTIDQITSWLTVGQQAADIYQTVKPASGGSASSPILATDPPPGTPLPTPQPKMSTTTKVLIGGGIAAAIGAIVYMSKKKKK